MFISKGYKGIYDLYFTHPISGKRSKVSTGTPIFKQAKKFLERFSVEDYLNPTVETISPKLFSLSAFQKVGMDYSRTNFSPKT